MKKNNSNEYKITAQGSLGLMALGHIGLRAWREEVKKKKKKSKASQKKGDEN
jgi:hypothetical protein